MEGFYIIFDRNSTRIGFAESTCPVRDKLALKSTIFGGIPYSGQFLFFIFRFFAVRAITLHSSLSSINLYILIVFSET
jgi:hypothetical protein